MNPCKFQIQPYPIKFEVTSYEPKKKGKSLDERKKSFKMLIWETIGKNYNEFSKEMLSDFFEHWSATKINGRVMGFEKEKTFDISLRLKKWKRNQETNFGKFVPKPAQPKVHRPKRLKEGQMGVIDHPIFNKDKFNLNR